MSKALAIGLLTAAAITLIPAVLMILLFSGAD